MWGRENSGIYCGYFVFFGEKIENQKERAFRGETCNIHFNSEPFPTKLDQERDWKNPPCQKIYDGLSGFQKEVHMPSMRIRRNKLQTDFRNFRRNNNSFKGSLSKPLLQAIRILN